MILVTGARGVVGAPLCQQLSRQERAFVAVSRSGDEHQLQWDMRSQLTQTQLSKLNGLQQLLHTAPIWLLPKHIALLASVGLKRAVVFSSSSVLSKQSSPNAQEQTLVRSLAEAEQALLRHCAEHQVSLTILRPSLIYGYGRDQNVSHIARFIHRWGFMLVVGKASGQRQPVHADDLVSAALSALDQAATNESFYTLAGAQVLSYREMVVAIFAGLSKTPRILSMPLLVYRFALSLAARFGKFAYTSEMANRMNQDLSYDTSSARVDLAFNPQPFLQQPQRDLKVHDE